MHGDSLVFGHLAATMMACVEGMDQEAAFLQALSAVSGYDHLGSILDLWSGDGLLARFEAREVEK